MLCLFLKNVQLFSFNTCSKRGSPIVPNTNSFSCELFFSRDTLQRGVFFDVPVFSWSFARLGGFSIETGSLDLGTGWAQPQWGGQIWKWPWRPRILPVLCIIIYVPTIDMQALESLVCLLLFAFFSHMLVVSFSLLLLYKSIEVNFPPNQAYQV